MAEYRTFEDSGTSERSRSDLSTALTFLLLGIGVGTIFAALITPKTGKQFRKAIRRGYEDARDAFEDWSDQAEGWLERGSQWADTATSKVSPIARRFKRDIR